MTGRDYRAFLSTHRGSGTALGRADEADKLLVRMKEGVGSSRYRPQDYVKLRTMALEKKVSANRSLLKMNRLQAASQSHKENTLLKQHRSAWRQNMTRLERARKSATSDVEGYFENATSESSHVNMFVFDAEESKLALDMELDQFRASTVDPVWTLRGDLRAWLDEHEARIGTTLDLALRREHADILGVVKDVKAQQERILDRLREEERGLEAELRAGFLGRVEEGGSLKRVVEGIPPEAESLECPDRGLREQILDEFLLLDQRFTEELRELERKYEHIVRPPLGGWDPDDHFLFQAIVEQYPPTLSNRRQLYMDMLRRRLGHKTRSELVAHEDWITSNRYFRELHRTQVTCWARAKEELYHKAVAIFADARLAEELREAEAINAVRQEEICSGLYAKVQAWREKKLEAARLEAEIQAKNRERLEIERMTELEKEKKRRTVQKSKITEFHEKRRKEEEREEELKRKELEALQTEMEEQAKIDRERVAFRREVEEEKKVQQEAKKHQAHLEEMERERRLDALRQMVAVHVDSDPYRVMKPTMASNAKAGIGAEEDINIQKPLFDMRGFSSEQMTSDPRMKLEQALRKAGLHENPYARKMIYDAKPVKPPRKDMESTVLKNMDNK